MPPVKAAVRLKRSPVERSPLARHGTHVASCAAVRSQKGIEMTGLMAGYAVASVAMLIAASAALTIIYGVGHLGTDEEPSRQDKPTKAAA
jgi:hypothetical protein